MGERFINIKFPFQESKKGFFVELNKTDNQAIKSDLMHLILTQKGQRLYMPDFGTNLLKYIFEPNDGITFGDIKTEINQLVKRYLPELIINDISIFQSDTNEHVAILRIDYKISDGVFESKDFVEIKI